MSFSKMLLMFAMSILGSGSWAQNTQEPLPFSCDLPAYDRADERYLCCDLKDLPNYCKPYWKEEAKFCRSL